MSEKVERMKAALLAELCRQRGVPMRADEDEIDYDGMTANQIDFDALAAAAIAASKAGGGQDPGEELGEKA